MCAIRSLGSVRAGVALAMLGSGCGGARVEVRNRGMVRLEDVVISAKGSSATIAGIDSQAVEQSAICPKGEAGSLAIRFRVDGHVHSSDHSVYFECDWLYIVRVEVAQDLTVSATASLR
jgi:hypothetical protein